MPGGWFFLSVDARTDAIKLTMAGRFPPFWVANTIWLERTELLITKR